MMAEGNKSLGEERRGELEHFGKRHREFYGDDVPVPEYKNPDSPEHQSGDMSLVRERAGADHGVQ